MTDQRLAYVQAPEWAVGDTAVVEGAVTRRWLDAAGDGLVELTVRTRSSRNTRSSTGVTVGPGTVVATMPRASRIKVRQTD